MYSSISHIIYYYISVIMVALGWSDSMRECQPQIIITLLLIYIIFKQCLQNNNKDIQQNTYKTWLPEEVTVTAAHNHYINTCLLLLLLLIILPQSPSHHFYSLVLYDCDVHVLLCCMRVGGGRNIDIHLSSCTILIYVMITFEII